MHRVYFTLKQRMEKQAIRNGEATADSYCSARQEHPESFPLDNEFFAEMVGRMAYVNLYMGWVFNKRVYEPTEQYMQLSQNAAMNKVRVNINIGTKH